MRCDPPGAPEPMVVHTAVRGWSATGTVRHNSLAPPQAAHVFPILFTIPGNTGGPGADRGTQGMDSSNNHSVRNPKLPVYAFSGRNKQIVNRLTRPGKSREIQRRTRVATLYRTPRKITFPRTAGIRHAREKIKFPGDSIEGRDKGAPRVPRDRERSLARLLRRPLSRPSIEPPGNLILSRA